MLIHCHLVIQVRLAPRLPRWMRRGGASASSRQVARLASCIATATYLSASAQLWTMAPLASEKHSASGTVRHQTSACWLRLVTLAPSARFAYLGTIFLRSASSHQSLHKLTTYFASFFHTLKLFPSSRGLRIPAMPKPPFL